MPNSPLSHNPLACLVSPRRHDSPAGCSIRRGGDFPGFKRNRAVQHRNASPAFTLMEVVAVLVIGAILAAVAISRVSATRDADVRAEVDTLKGHLRYAQYLAMNDIPPNQWGINLAPNSYTLVIYDSDNMNTTTSPFHLPGENSATHTFPTGISAFGNTLVVFNEWGSPVTGNAVLTVGGENITITAQTGFIP